LDVGLRFFIVLALPLQRTSVWMHAHILLLE
jgi:hypothetical protein